MPTRVHHSPGSSRQVRPPLSAPAGFTLSGEITPITNSWRLFSSIDFSIYDPLIGSTVLYREVRGDFDARVKSVYDCRGVVKVFLSIDGFESEKEVDIRDLATWNRELFSQLGLEMSPSEK